MAGFEPSTQGNYYLPRAKILPPEPLIWAVWPWADTWLDWFKSYGERAEGDRAEDDREKEEDRNDMAAQGFLRLLDHLRTILLQDSILLREQFLQHPIWSDPIFRREDYREFAEQLCLCCAVSKFCVLSDQTDRSISLVSRSLLFHHQVACLRRKPA